MTNSILDLPVYLSFSQTIQWFFLNMARGFFLWTVSRKLKSCRSTMDHCSLRPWRQILRAVGGDPDLIKDWMSEGIQNGSRAAGLFVCQQTSI